MMALACRRLPLHSESRARPTQARTGFAQEDAMTRTKTACGLATLLAAVLVAGPAAAIKCQDGNQLVQGNWLATPYCQDQLLAQVATERGFKASPARSATTPTTRKSCAASCSTTSACR